jgi:hypothetical protein
LVIGVTNAAWALTFYSSVGCDTTDANPPEYIARDTDEFAPAVGECATYFISGAAFSFTGDGVKALLYENSNCDGDGLSAVPFKNQQDCWSFDSGGKNIAIYKIIESQDFRHD